MFNKVKTFFGFVEEEENETSLTEQIQVEVPKPIFKKSVTSTNKQSAELEIRVEEPIAYEDSLTLATYLRDNKPVIVNLKHLDEIAGKRLIDFVCGTAYAIGGHMMKIGDQIFLFTPKNIHITDSAPKQDALNGLGQSDSNLIFNKVAM